MNGQKNNLIGLAPWSVSFLGLMSTLDNPNSCEIVAFDGELDLGLLESAVAFVITQHPILQSKVVKKGLQFYWQKVDSAPPRIHIHVLTTDLQGEIDEYLYANNRSNPLDVFSRIPIEVHYIKTPQRSYLQILSSHACSDALSGCILIDEIREAYNNLRQGFPLVDNPKTAYDGFSAFVSGFSFMKRVKLYALALWTLIKLILSPGKSMVLTGSQKERGQSVVKKHDLDPEVLSRTKIVAKKNRSTVQGVLTLATARVIDDINIMSGRINSTIRMADVFSIRHLANKDTEREYNNFAVPYFYEIDLAESDSRLLERRTQQLYQLKHNDGMLVEIYAHRIYALLIAFTPRKLWPLLLKVVGQLVLKANFLLTNPGIFPLSLESFSGIEIEDFYNFNATYGRLRLNIIFSTFRDQFRLVLVTDDRYIHSNHVDSLIEKIERSLLDAIHTLDLASTETQLEPNQGTITTSA